MTTTHQNSTPNVITDHLDIWASTIKKKKGVGRGSSKKIELYGVKKLRELILELAVRGLLVPQDSNDEPASALLKKADKEKAQLIKGKKIKKQKPLPQIVGEDELFDLPAGWEWAQLGRIGNIFNGNSINARIKEEKYTGIEGLPFIATKDVGYGFEPIDYANGVCIPIDEPKFKVAYKGAVLVCAEGGSAGKKCGVVDRDICFGNKLFANQLLGGISSTYVLSIYLTHTFYKKFSEAMTGIIGGISALKFIQLLVPIAPLKEQHRIVAKVDELMALCDQLEQQTEASLTAHQTLVETLLGTLTNAANSETFDQAWQRIAQHFDTLFTTEHSIDQLKQTILQLAVMGKLVPQDPNDEPASELLVCIAKEKQKLIQEKKIKKQKPISKISDGIKPFELPLSWEWCKFIDIAHLITDGTHHTPTYTDAGIPFLSVKDMSSGTLCFDDTRFISQEEHEELTKRCNPEKNDLLLTKVGTTWIPILINTNTAFSLFVSVALIKFPIDKINGEYLCLLVSSPLVKKQSTEGTQGIGNKNLVLRTISNFNLAIPALEEQIRIVKKVNELVEICDQLKSNIVFAHSIELDLSNTISQQAIN